MLSLNDFHGYILVIRSKATADAYTEGAKRLTVFMRRRGITFADAPRTLLMDFAHTLGREGLAARSMRLRIAGAKRFIRWLESNGVAVPRFEETDIPKPTTKVQAHIDTDVLMRFLDSVKARPEPYRTVILLLPFTGLRVEEMCSLKVSSLRRDNGKLSLVFLGKGRKERLVPVSAEAKRILDIYAAYRFPIRSRWLFPTPSDPTKPITQGLVRHHVYLSRGETDLAWITPHKLRHVFATLLSEAGVRIEVIQELLGHASILTTRMYVHPSNGAMQDAVEQMPEVGT